VSRLPAHRRQRFGRVFRFEFRVVGVGEFPGCAIELDFLERAQRDRLRAHVVVRVIAFIDGRIGRGLARRAQNRE